MAVKLTKESVTMGRYAKEARYHFDRIQYYHRHAGFKAYSQSKHHYSKLTELIIRAERSKNDKNDAIVIQALQESVAELMEEMRKRDEGSNT